MTEPPTLDGPAGDIDPAWMDELILRAVDQLLARYAVSSDAAPAAAGPAVAAVLNFGGGLAGTVGVVADANVLTDVAPDVGEAPLDVEDWAGELVNRAAGLIKSQLVRAGYEIHLAPPVSMRGVSIEVHPDAGNRWFVFTGPSGRMQLWIDYDPHPAAAPVESDGEPLRPGDCLFF